MRVVFMGTPDFSVGTLKAIIDAGHEVVGVITQPDKQRGRGKAMMYPPVKEAALKYGLPVSQPKKVKDPEFIETLKAMEPEVIVVVAFGQILPEAILKLPPYGCINVHASLLPKYRGAAPIQWAVIDGEAVTGVTTMRMDAGLDTGDMIMKAEVPVAPDETGESLHDKLSEAGAALLVKTLDALREGTAVFEKQDDSKSCYAKMLTKELGRIDWTQDAEAIERLIRGLNSWPSAYTGYHGKTLKIWKAEVQNGDSDSKPGEICEVTKDSVCVQTGKNRLVLREVQMEGKKRMAVDAFLRGYPAAVGEVLGEA